MSNDRSWMYHRLDRDNYILNEYVDGVQAFVSFAINHPGISINGDMRCPCRLCDNRRYHHHDVVGKHLLSNGFTQDYFQWIHHGEDHVPNEEASTISTPTHADQNSYTTMVNEAFGFNNDNMEGMWNECVPPTLDVSKYSNLMKDADEQLWDGCVNYTKLSAISELMNLKSEFHWSQRCLDRVLSAVSGMLPSGAKLPTNSYDAKKVMLQLGLPYQKIHACVKHCMLYYKEDVKKNKCDVCGHPRYKERSSNTAKKVPYKVLRYFPLAPRLQRLYMSGKTAKDMTWHAFNRSTDGIMSHPTDSKAWKHFDRTYPGFASEPRNVRIGLCTDGFDPFGKFSKGNYSCWPVISCVYNLPPGLCMKSPYMYLSLIVPGPKSPGNKIDIYLRPLIDELKELWDIGVVTYDAYRKQMFLMKTALMWTINDFPAYGMLSGWSTHGRLACPYCMERTKSFRLVNGRKPCWFDCHRQFLPCDHPYRKQKDKFVKGVVDLDYAPPRLSGQQIFDRICCYPDIKVLTEHDNKKISGYGTEHNWRKKSIFWELSYWTTNLIRHNLDVMHVEKNVFENLFYTIMDEDGKTKDNLNARKDLASLCKRKELEIRTENNRVIKPKASYTLSKEQRRNIRKWLQNLKLPDGYASNISKCVESDDDKFSGFKSHDCHVLIERLIPVAFRHLLPNPVWESVTELCYFFRDICSTILQVRHMEVLKRNIVETLCKLEKIFPPAFFDSMEHLPVHLAYEAEVGGPVQYRWMYPFESYMFELKKKVKNKAHIEGSIAEAYILEEVCTFASFYFDSNVQTKLNQVPRNDDGGDIEASCRFSLFSHPGKPFGRARRYFMKDSEADTAHIYILLNTPEVIPYLEKYSYVILEQYPNMSEAELDTIRSTQFAKWFRNHVCLMNHVDPQIFALAQGPQLEIKLYRGYFVNGFLFDNRQGRARKTNNSGVCVMGTCYNDDHQQDYYGILVDVWQLWYPGGNSTILFKCDWFKYDRRINMKKYGIVEVLPKSKMYEDAPFILASQARQVYYLPYVSKKHENSWVVCKTRARNRVDISFIETKNDEFIPQYGGYFQEDESSEIIPIVSSPALDNPDILVDGQHFEYVQPEDLDGANLRGTMTDDEEGEQIADDMDEDDDEDGDDVEDDDDDDDDDEDDDDDDDDDAADDEVEDDDDELGHRNKRPNNRREH